MNTPNCRANLREAKSDRLHTCTLPADHIGDHECACGAMWNILSVSGLLPYDIESVDAVTGSGE